MLLILLAAGSIESRAQSCSVPECRTTSIQLNTGRNHASSDETYSANVFDAWWGIESDNDANTTESRRASIMPAYPTWPTQPNSEWAWRDFISSDPLTGTTVYYTEFEVCEPGMVDLNISVIAPDGGQVSLNGGVLFAVAPGLTPTGYVSGVPVMPGINTLRVEVYNSGSPAVALNLVGTITSDSESLITRQCGPFKNGISLFVFDDLDQDGEVDDDEVGMGDVQVDLTNPSGNQTGYSTGDGRVWFETGAGESNLTVVAPPGWNVVSGTTHTVTLAAGASAVTLKSALTTCVSVQILKFNDENCNGVRDSNEVAMPGWVINFSNGQQGVTRRAPLAIKLCNNVTTVDVWEVIPPNTCWVQTYPAPTTIHTINVVPGVWIYEAFFGNSSTGTIRIAKFNDLNGDGVWGADEPGLPNWEFTITSATLNQLVQTGADGFVEVRATCGTYTVCEVLQAGWCPTTPLCQVVDVYPCTDTDVQFGNTQGAGICVHKFNDRNCNKQQDGGEESLAGWTFDITDGATTVSVTTDITGSTCATLTAGTWTICEVTKAGWSPTMYSCTTITIAACDTESVIFGNASTGSICVTKYQEMGTNAHYNPGTDPLLQGWVFQVWNDTETQLITTGTTGVDGRVCFEDLPLGDYFVKEIQQNGWVATQPHPLDGGYYFTVTACCNLEFEFGNKQEACETNICVHKFNDINCNGTQDSGEPDLSGWRFQINNNTTTIWVTTGTTGRACAIITAATWSVCEELKSGWSPTNGNGCTTVTIQACQTEEFEFANSSTGTLQIFKFNDFDCNGWQDAAVEPGIAGWKMNIVGPGGVTYTLTTDASGYATMLATSGTYTICEEQRQCWTPTTQTCATVTVTPCQTATAVFGNTNISVLTIWKFEDLNGNGKKEPNEPTIPGWFIDAPGVGVQPTDISGKLWLVLPCGTYSACEIQQPGWINTTPICQTTNTVACRMTEIWFGNQRCTGNICITKFNDRNCDGQQQAGEENLPGWTFSITDGVVTETVTTGSLGTTCATVMAGSWTITEQLQTGWAQTTSPSIVLVTCGTGTVYVKFGNSSTGSICAHKYNDLDSNGQYDGIDYFMPDWTMELWDASQTTLIDVQMTDSSGMACFTNLPLGSYFLKESQQPFWVQTEPAFPATGYAIDLVQPCNTLDRFFGNNDSCSFRICGTKYWERAHGPEGCNGIVDPDETGLANWTITIDDGMGWTDTTITDSNGHYCFDVPHSGAYIVTEDTPPGFMSLGIYSPTQPVYIDCFNPTLTVDFLNCPMCQEDQSICRADSLHILSNPAVYKGNTVLVVDPSGGPTPRNGVDITPWVPMPPVSGSGVQWIGPDNTAGAIDPPGDYIWHRYFCVCEGMTFTIVRIRLCFKGVEDVTVALSNGVQLGTYTFPNAETCIDTSVVIGPGCHFIEFKVTKQPVTPPDNAALSYNGSIAGPGIMRDNCCSCYSQYVDPDIPVEMTQPTGSGHSFDGAIAPGSDAESHAVTGFDDRNTSLFDPALVSIPNPTNGATTVYYTLPQNLDVQLELYNSVGQHLMTLEHGPQQAGKHSVQLDMAEVPSGFYHLRLTAGGRVYTLRLMNTK